MQVKNLIMILGIVINSLILFLFDKNTLTINSYLFIILVSGNFILSILIVRNCLGRINNITSIFMVFWSLYILFPLILAPEEIGHLGMFTHLNNLALISFLTGFLSLLKFSKFPQDTNNSIQILGKISFLKYDLRVYGLIIMLFSIIMEFVNFYRVGGMETFNRGKATFISEKGDLFLTLPSFDIFLIGILFYLFSSLNKKNKISRGMSILFYVFISIAFIYFSLISLRTNILTILTLIIMVKTYELYIKNIKFKLILFAIIAFVALTVVGQNRSLLSQIDFSNIMGTLSQLDFSIIQDSNGGRKNNEFTSASENFELYFEDPEKLKANYYVGESYVSGLLYIFPRYFYPGGEKPLQITTVFRDNYVPERAKWGMQATTGFSTIIESYLNGGYVGVYMYYLFIGLLLAYAELKRLSSNKLIYHIFYLSTVPLLFTFSRRAFAIIYSGLFTNLVYIAFFIFILLFFIELQKKTSRKNVISTHRNYIEKYTIN